MAQTTSNLRNSYDAAKRRYITGPSNKLRLSTSANLGLKKRNTGNRNDLTATSKMKSAVNVSFPSSSLTGQYNIPSANNVSHSVTADFHNYSHSNPMLIKSGMRYSQQDIKKQKREEVKFENCVYINPKYNYRKS